MKLLQCAVTFYLLTCCHINGTSVNQVKMSRCRNYGTCYNSDWCSGVLSSRNYSETHLVKKLECLSALLDDRSDVTHWSNTIDNLTNNVSMTIKRVHNLTDEMVSIKGTVTDTTTKLNEHCKETEELNKKIKLVEEDCETLKGNVTYLGDVRLKMEQQDKSRGETINVLTKDFNNLKNSFESFKSDIGNKHTDIDAKVINATRDNEDSIKNSEKKLKDQFEKEILESKNIINALEQNVTANQEQLNKTLRSLHQTVSEQENRFNGSLNRLSKEMHGKFNIFETENKNLDDKIKHEKNEMDRNIQTKTESVRQTLDDNIDRISKDLERKIEDVSTLANTTIDNTIAELKQLSERLSESENNLKNILKSETEKLQSSIDADMKKLNTEMENFKMKTDERFGNSIEEIATVKVKVDKVKSECEQKIQNVETTFTELVNKKIYEVKSSQETAVKETKNAIDKLQTETKEMIKTEIETLLKKTLEVNQTVSQQQKLVDVIYPNTFNKEMFTMAFLVLVVMVAINFIIVYILVKRTSQPLQVAVRGISRENKLPATHLTEEPHSPVETYNRLKFPKSLPTELSVPLSDSVAVISFYEDAQKHHRRLMSKVEEGLTADVIIEYHVIRRHEHIPEIPRAKLCIMFVEFSERHVIIEEPGLGLGDLKRKTASFIKDMGACLTIVYVRDPGSRHLKASDLYNSSIYCVKSQPELSELSNNGRFLSVYDNFNEYQTQRLAEVITTNLGQGHTLNPTATTKRIRNASGGKLQLNVNT